MTKQLAGEEIAAHINEIYPNAVSEWNDTDAWVGVDHLLDVSRFLVDADGLDFKFLMSISAVDYVEYFELVYHLLSMRLNQSAILKTRCYGRDDPTVPSVVEVWRGADLQERELWDLMGVRFDGHPNMKRIMLWEGFPGHPLRKDYLR